MQDSQTGSRAPTTATQHACSNVQGFTSSRFFFFLTICLYLTGIDRDGVASSSVSVCRVA